MEVKIENENDVIQVLERLLKEHRIEEGLAIIKQYETIIVKKYYEFTQYKILFLIENAQYLDAKMIINSELNVPYIPHDFEIFLHEKNKLVQYELQKDKPSIKKEWLQQLDQLNDEQLMAILPHLNEYNLNLYLQSFQNILLNEEISNVTKSLILALLTDQKINADFLISKDHQKCMINPMTLMDIRDSKEQKWLHAQIERLNLDIQSKEIALQMADMALLEHYPFSYSQEECMTLFCSIISLIEEMMNLTITDTIYLHYQLNHQQKIGEFCKKLNNLIKTL